MKSYGFMNLLTVKRYKEAYKSRMLYRFKLKWKGHNLKISTFLEILGILNNILKQNLVQ